MIKLLKMTFLLLLNFKILTASDWRLVEEFDNTPTWSNSNVQSINCWDSNNCYSIVQHATKKDYGCRIYTSSNNGISWESLLSNEYEYPQMLNVKAGVSPHSNYYFILSDDNTFLEKSTDGGKTFQIITLEQNNNYPDKIAMYDTNTGLIINSEAIYTTTDGWDTFESHPKLNNDQVYYSPIFIDSNTVVMSYVANIRWNDNKGFAFVKFHLNENKWDTISYFGRDSNNWIDAIKSLCFINDTIGFGCGTRNTDEHNGQYYDIIYKTTDSGYNWDIIHKEFINPYEGFDNNIAFYDEKNGIAVGHYGKIAMTNDGGETWVYEQTPNEMDNCRKMLVCWAGQTPLIGTWDGGIFRYEGDFFDFPDDTISVKDVFQNEQINVRQEENRLLISIEDELFRKYKLQICDIMGNVVMNEDLQSGVGTLFKPVDISGLSNSVYLFIISTNGLSIKTGKFIYIK
jgi:hypothetical protein